MASKGKSKEHLQGDLEDPPVYQCRSCNRDFKTQESLRQHARDSPAHSPSVTCDLCYRTFNTDEALEQHRKHARIHQPESQQPRIKTPLDEFFLSFEGFEYNPAHPPARSFERLGFHHDWESNSPAYKNARKKYQDALNSELQMWYGSTDDLKAWHTLCRAIGIKPLPESCSQCKKAVRKKHVNIVDLIDWARHRETSDTPVQTFRSVAQLQTYTVETDKIFSKKKAKAGAHGKNTVLKHLLRTIF
ncbi:hypothetical protein MCOR25_009532 [Pyricularia grisea]|nr:hypothetical protein MCOR25_009532 [Pyricularia grisea]